MSGVRQPVEGLRGPREGVEGLVYFGRMVDKLRLESMGKLPEDYRANLGEGFDKACCEFLAKRGRRDERADRLLFRKKEAGWEKRDEIETFFDYIDADEGRLG